MKQFIELSLLIFIPFVHFYLTTYRSRFKTNIDIKEAHKETLFDKFILVLKNKFGRLKIERKDFQDVFQTLASGAGEFVIKECIWNK